MCNCERRVFSLGTRAVLTTLYAPFLLFCFIPTQEQQLCEQARASIAAGDYVSAASVLHTVVQRNPRSEEGYFLLGVLLHKRGDYTGAERMLLRVLELRPGSVSVINNLGVNALQQKQEDKAERYFLEVTKLEPENVDALFNLGLLEVQQKRFEAAAMHLEKAAEQRPSDVRLLQVLLGSQLELSRTQAIESTVRRILSAAPKEPAFYIQLAAVLGAKGADNLAVSALEQARGQWPAYAPIREHLGDMYEKGKRFDRAAVEYQAAVQLDPNNDDYHFSLGYEFILHHNFELAERSFTAAVKALPRAPKLRVGLSAAYFGRTQYPEAIRALRDALDLDPGFEPAYLLLGHAFTMLSDHEDLFTGTWIDSSFRNYLALKPDQAYPNYLCALSELRRNNHTEALRLLKKALDLDPKLAEAWLAAGKIYSEDGQHPEAITAFETAIHIDPTLISAHYRLARSYQKIGNDTKARLALAAHQTYLRSVQTNVSEREKQILRFVYTLK
jgi:tetratricopeptide (TPR) repeat protein